MFRIAPECVGYNAFLDAEAPLILQQIIPRLSSEFLSDTVLGFHQRGDERVRMLDFINLVITAELPRQKFLGFVAAEVNPDNDRAILHIVYVLRGFRGLGAAHLLLDQYESMLVRFGITNTTVAALTSISLSLLDHRARINRVRYDIRRPSPEHLVQADRDLVND